VAGRSAEPVRASVRHPAAMSGQAAARRAPFVSVVLLIIGCGLVALLVLNTAIAADSFAERSLSQQIEQLQLREQQLRQEVSAAHAPAALAQAAAEQGMIPSGTSAFLVIAPDGTTQVVGKAKPASRQPPAGANPPAAPGGNG